MEVKELLLEIEKIANAITCKGMPENIKNIVQQTKAQTGFILFVTKSGMMFYRLDDKNEVNELLDNVRQYEREDMIYFLYEYDTCDIRPTFTDDLFVWAADKYGIK